MSLIGISNTLQLNIEVWEAIPPSGNEKKEVAEAKSSMSFSDSTKNMLDQSLEQRNQILMPPIIHNLRKSERLVHKVFTPNFFLLDPWRTLEMLASNLILSVSRYIYGDSILRRSRSFQLQPLFLFHEGGRGPGHSHCEPPDSKALLSGILTCFE